MIRLTTQEAIKEAVRKGRTVHWMNDGYTVRRNKSGTIVVDFPVIKERFVSHKLQRVISQFGASSFYIPGSTNAEL